MIRIHIRREVSEGTEAELQSLINELRGITTGQPGYISGETLKRVDKPGESLVVSKWQSLKFWNLWLENPERSAIQKKIDSLLGCETIYEIYEFE